MSTQPNPPGDDVKFTDDDIRERRKEYATALRTETEASLTVRAAWKKLVAMLDELLERRRKP